MPVLRYSLLAILIVLASGCSRPSPEYEHIRKLPYDKWPAYGETLPVKERLDLQMEIVKRSGHPPAMDMVPAFKADPLETYKEVVSRISHGDDNRYYREIIYAIDGAKGFEICSQNDRKVVQNYLWHIATPAVPPKDRPAFYSC